MDDASWGVDIGPILAPLGRVNAIRSFWEGPLPNPPHRDHVLNTIRRSAHQLLVEIARLCSELRTHALRWTCFETPSLRHT
jgi:hypothetical protein